MPDSTPRQGELFTDTRGRTYQVVANARHAATGEKLVICQAMFGDYSCTAVPCDRFASCFTGLKRQVLSEAAEKPGTDEPSSGEADTDGLQGVNGHLLAFLDADDVQKKYEILNDMPADEIDDQMVDTMAVSLDVVIPEGPLDMRVIQLKNILRTRGQYELKRFR